MIHLLLAVIYVSFISLGLPDSLRGGSVAFDLSGVGGSGLLLRCDLLHHISGNGVLQPAK